MYKDFHVHGHDCKYVIEKCFHGNVYNDIILGTFITIKDSELFDKCITQKSIGTHASKTCSQEEADQILESKSFITINLKETNKYELKLIIKGSHRLEIDSHDNFTRAAKLFYSIKLLRMKNLIKTIMIKGRSLDRMKLIEIIKREKDKELNDQEISIKLEKLLIH